jgi:hypothetical protein
VASVGRPRAEGIARFYPGRDQRTSVRACHVRAGGPGETSLEPFDGRSGAEPHRALGPGRAVTDSARGVIRLSVRRKNPLRPHPRRIAGPWTVSLDGVLQPRAASS